MISEFKGDYHFLSNFHVEKDGKTTEHRFQAAKAANWDDRKLVMATATPGAAKKMGRKIALRPDWEMVKDHIMYQLLLGKFVGDESLKKKLLATGTEFLQEGNYWGDKYWGVDIKTGEGQNRLGYLLMHVRSNLAFHKGV
jgi:ribA/ribD-fused uncharacterized protein